MQPTNAATPPAARRASAAHGSMDRERDYYAERRDRDRQSTRTLEVWKEGRLLEELDLTACRRYTVGRTEGSDVWTEHESCSRTHAEFRVEADGVFLVDLDSAAGTCVGAARLTPHEPRRLHDLAKVTSPAASLARSAASNPNPNPYQGDVRHIDAQLPAQA